MTAVQLRRSHGRVVLACLLSLLAFWSSLLSAQLRDERAVRAAYVFNLTKYVEWAPKDNQLVIGFEGSRATGEMLKKMLDGKTSEAGPIQVLLFPSDEELKKCSILYITDPQEKRARSVLDNSEIRNLLTVGETASFARDGGMVGLVKAGDQIQVQVNLEAAQRAGIKISSRLLNLALIVHAAPSARN